MTAQIPPKRRRRWNRRIRISDAETAIYLDFEGTTDERACFVGVLDQLDGDGWRVQQFAFDPSLQLAAAADSTVRVANHTDFVEWLKDRSEQHRAKVLSWSEHDVHVLYELDPNLAIRYRNARALAATWSRSLGLIIPGDLQSYLDHIGFDRPVEVQSGAADWIRYIRDRVENAGSWSTVSPGAVERWRRLREHNATDLWGMKAVIDATLTRGESAD